jgi:hypothetical protein
MFRSVATITAGEITMKSIMPKLLVAFAALFILSACEAEVGSKEWCDEIKQKDKGDVTASQAADFAKHCVFGGAK